MEKAGKKAYMSRIVVLAFVIAILGMGGERVCFGLSAEPAINKWWAGAKAGEPNYWMDPCNWGTIPAVPTAVQSAKYQFPVPPDGVGQSGSPPGYTGDPNVVIIRTTETAECNYLGWGGQQTYANLVIQGTLNMGRTRHRLRSANHSLDKLAEKQSHRRWREIERQRRH